MIDYILKIFSLLTEKMKQDISKGKKTPTSENLFTVNEEKSVKLIEKDRLLVHSSTEKLLFLGKRARPDMQTPVAFLCIRVKVSDEDDYKKIERVMGYLYGKLYIPLILGTNKSGNIYWWKDGAHAVHQDMKVHTGLFMSFGHGAYLSASLKQKTNTMSYTETEKVEIADGMPNNMWVLYFTRAKGKEVKDKFLNEDNTSAISLAKNGNRSSVKMTKHINIRYFFVADKIKQGEVTIIHLPIKEMISEDFTKPLHGSLFQYFRYLIMGISMNDYEQYRERYQFLAKGRKHIDDAKTEANYGARANSTLLSNNGRESRRAQECVVD